MKPSAISSCIVVEDAQPAREFYTENFDAQIVFDCGWYVNIEFGEGGPTLQFMERLSDDQPLFRGGVTYNLQLESTELVNEAHDRLAEAGLTEVMPLEDHEWGDRGFAVLDPYGVALYFYADIEPSAEFQQYYR